MIIDGSDSVTEAVMQAMRQGKDPRLFEVMSAFVRHMHAFVREVRLTEKEWEEGVAFLNRIGQATHDLHNEGILFSDAIGVSTLVCLLNNGNNGATESAAALLGPFWRLNAPETDVGGSIVRSPTPGPELWADCRIVDTRGAPIPDVTVHIWHSAPTGFYENQDPDQADMNLRGVFHTGADGRFAFRSTKPAGYPVPTGGPVGDLLRAQNRHPYRPAHLHVLAHKEDWKTLVTQVFVDDDPNLDSDVVFGVTQPLVGHYVRHEDGAPPAPGMAAPWYTFNYDFMMEPGVSELPIPPIK